MTEINWREVHKQEAVDHVRDFYQSSWTWRSQAYHQNWDKYQRNYLNIYDPTIKARKEVWQATMFSPMTFTHCEVVSSALFRALFGSKRYAGFEPREGGDELQAELNTKLLEYYMEKSGFVETLYDIIKNEAVIYGSGFAKIFKTDKDIRIEKVHIRDFFKEPNSIGIERCIQRHKMTYGSLLKMSRDGTVDKKSVEDLRGIEESDRFEQEVSVIHQEQGRNDPKLVRPSFDRNHTVFEFYGPVPRKWIDLDMAGDTDKANEIVPGRVLIASGNYFLASEETEEPVPPFVQGDYVQSGFSYGIGVPQILEGLQEEFNEIRNQRIDNVSLIMNKMIGVLSEFVADPKDLVSKPGGIVRFRSKAGELDDIRKAFMPIEIPDITRSAYTETFEIERQSQEATGANRVTTGSAGLVKDQNQTLGGMELLRQAANERFIVYAFMLGRKMVVEAARRYVRLIHRTSTKTDIRRILGSQPIEILPGQIVAKWSSYRRIPPDELFNYYDIVPVDIFAASNKFAKAQQIMSFLQLAASILPNFNPRPALVKAGKLLDLSSEEVHEILGPDVGPIASPSAQGFGIPSLAAPSRGNQETPSPTQPPTSNSADILKFA